MNSLLAHLLVAELADAAGALAGSPPTAASSSADAFLACGCGSTPGGAG